MAWSRTRLASVNTHMASESQFPADSSTRDRLRRAQKAERESLRKYTTASRRVAAEFAKRDQVLSAHGALIDKAQAELAKALSALVTVSGVDRAAVLVGLAPADVRASVKAHREDARLKPAST
jgi:hypothetical protein